MLEIERYKSKLHLVKIMALEEKTRFVSPPDAIIRTWRTSRLYCLWLNLSALEEGGLSDTDADTLERVTYVLQNRTLGEKYGCYNQIADTTLRQQYRQTFLVPEDKDVL